MMFIVRGGGAPPDAAGVEVKLSRPTPPIVAKPGESNDFFCLGDADAIAGLRAAGWNVVDLHDGYYEDGRGGGVAIWGQGRFWEIRDTPLTVKEAVGPSGESKTGKAEGEHVEVRRAIFGA